MAHVENEKICSILAWIFPIGLIWYFVDENLQKSKLAKHHVKQSLILFIASMIILVVGSIIPFIGWFIILPLGQLVVFVFWVIGLISAFNEQTKELPVIGQFAKHLKF